MRGPSNVVDPAWVSVEWTLGRAMRTGRFWWIVLAYFCGLFAWYAVQVHQTKYLVEVGFTPFRGGLGARNRERRRHPRADRPRGTVRPRGAGMGVVGRDACGFAALLRRA